MAGHVFREFLVVADTDCHVHRLRRSVADVRRRSVFTYLVWMVLVGLLIVAAPVFGVLALVSGLALAWRAGR